MANEGNQWWKRRSQHGRAMIFSSPLLMWDAACDYFKSEDEDKSWTKTQVATFEGQILTEEISCRVPYTWQGLALYCDTYSTYFKTFRNTCKKKLAEGIDVELMEDFLSVLNMIDEVIFRHNYNNAAIGVFKEGLTARYLRINDNTQLSTPNGNGSGAEDDNSKEFKITLKLD